jgi:hypothetical protein
MKRLLMIFIMLIPLWGMAQATYEYRFNPFTNQPDWVRSDIGGGSSVWDTIAGGGIYYDGGDVGIGTATPGFALDVNGDVGIRNLPLFDSDTMLVMKDDSIGYALVPAAGDTSYFDLTGTVLSTKDAITSVESAPLYDRGFTWTARAATEPNQWYSVTYGNGLFVAVSSIGTNRVMTSPDGVTWTARSATEANRWWSITYGNGLFVAVSFDGTNRVMTSPDGVTWTARAAAEANAWRSVTYGNGLFVAVSYTGTNRVMTSPDGVTWTARAAEANLWWSITYGNGLFVAVSYDGTNRVMTSPDGVTWTARSATEANAWRSVTYGNGLFVAVSTDGTNRVMTSPDGVTWTARSAIEANQWLSVTYGDGLFVAVSYDGTNRVMTSPDGVTWTARAAAEASQWQSVAYGNGLFVAVADGGTNRVMTSGYSLQKETPTKNIYQGGMVIQGDVGIGTTSPQEKLDIGYASGVFLRAFRGTTDTDITGWIMTNENGDTCYVYPNAAGDGITVSTTKP